MKGQPVIRFFVFVALLVAFHPLSAAAQSESDASVSTTESSVRYAATGELLVPMPNDAGLSRLAYGIGIAWWNKVGMFLLNPRLAGHYSPGSGGAYYLNIATDIGVYVAPLQGTVMPIAGAGAGFRYLRMRGPSKITTGGTIVRATFDSSAATSYLGVAGFVRVGAIFVFGDKFRPMVSVDYVRVRFNVLGPVDFVLVSAGVAL